MLIQFRFKNFKSFRDDTILDMSATKISEFSDSVVSVGKEKVLPVSAIYGANASGKSNIYDAFFYMSKYVAYSFSYGDEKDTDNEPIPFLFDNKSENSESMFEVYFILPDDKSEKIYNYGFCVKKDRITEEWLNIRAKTAKEARHVFYRSKEEGLDLSGLSKGSQNNIKLALNDQVLIVSLGAKLKVDRCKKVRDWFLSNEFANFGDPFSSLILQKRLPKGFAENEEIRHKVVEYLSSFDESIKDFKIEKMPKEEGSNKEYIKISSLHKKTGSEDLASIPLDMESAGTLKMLALYPDLESVLENGGLFFVDELNARLHPLLVRNFILLFLNPEINVNHAQLIFTVHDTWQLSNRLLRRDEIWFTEKNSEGVSKLYSLADFVDEEGNRIRKDESYEKNYLLGKYGAIPTLKSINVFMEGDSEERKKGK